MYDGDLLRGDVQTLGTVGEPFVEWPEDDGWAVGRPYGGWPMPLIDFALTH